MPVKIPTPEEYARDRSADLAPRVDAILARLVAEMARGRTTIDLLPGEYAFAEPLRARFHAARWDARFTESRLVGGASVTLTALPLPNSGDPF